MSVRSKFLNNPWFILAVLITCFVPVVIDSTVLHMAIPPLTLDLKASGTQVLWMLDIYSLFMAGLLIPMGVLGDKIGHHRLLLSGVLIFAIASLAAGFSEHPMHLIFARILLATGGAMIMPTTLAIIRQTFQSERQRGIALGIWVIFANGGAAIGPLFGGLLIDYFSWRAIFFINIPILLLALPFVAFALPKSISDPTKKWVLKYAILLIVAIIMVVYSIKTIPKLDESLSFGIISGAAGLILLYLFYKLQKGKSDSIVDWTLMKKPRVKYGMLFTFIPMTICSGFELLLSQELQLVHEVSPTKTALYIAPFFFAFALSGALGAYLRRIGILQIIVSGLAISTVSFFVMSQMGFAQLTAALLFWLLMAGFGLGIIMLAASFSIMSGADDENAGAAGSMESIAYEMGVGLGVTFFGVMLSQVFSRTLIFDSVARKMIPKEVYHSINDALVYANEVGGEIGLEIQDKSKLAFENAHSAVLIACSVILLLFTIQMSLKWYKDRKSSQFKIK